MLLAALLLTAGLVWRATVPRWLAGVDYPLQLDAEEGFLLNQALTLARGESIYQPIDRPPWLVGNYTPGYPFIYAALHSVLLGQAATPASLALGRRIVQACALLAALALALTVWRRGGGWAGGALGAALLLGAWETAHWALFARVDFPALALTLVGFGLFLTARRRWTLAAAGGVLALATATRQTAVLAPLAAGLALLANDRRGLAWLAAGYGVVAAAVFGGLQRATAGEFWRHTVTCNMNVMDWTMWRRLLVNEVWFFDRWWLAALGLTAMAGLMLRVGGRRDAIARRFPRARGATAIYALLATQSIVSYAKVGAAPNYMLEPIAAWALWGMEAYGRIARSARRSGVGFQSSCRGGTGFQPVILRWGFLGLIAFFYTLHAARPWLNGNVAGAFRGQIAPVQRIPTLDALRLVSRLRETPGEVLCEDPVAALLAGKRVWIQPFIMSRLAREGLWNPSEFLKMIDNKEFDVVALGVDVERDGPDYERWTAAMAEALRRAYRAEGTGMLGTGPVFLRAPAE
jgi:hypothetical protein